MENVVTLSQKVNGSGEKPTVDDVIAWVETQKDKADMGEAGARMRTTSLRQMLEQVAEDEPTDAQWLHDNMEQMRARWARRNPSGKANTGNTYASRARATIREYLRWVESGGKFDPFSRSESPKSSAKPGPKKAKAKEQPPPPPVQPPPVVAEGQRRTFPLADGREIVFALPPGERMKLDDLLKFMMHLLPLTDFDVRKPDHVRLFALMANGGSE